MSMHPDPHEELAAAIAAEHAAWNQVKDKLPGSPAYEEALWASWQTAVQRCREARQAVDAAAGCAHLTEAKERTREE
jgi:hypothetical protein